MSVEYRIISVTSMVLQNNWDGQTRVGTITPGIGQPLKEDGLFLFLRIFQEFFYFIIDPG